MLSAKPSLPESTMERILSEPDKANAMNATIPTQTPPDLASKDAPTEEMIMIRRTYAFAGENTTEEKLVARSSAEATLFLASQKPALPAPSTGVPLRKPKKRTSMFEPGLVGGSSSSDKGPKLNTIEKSKLDWAGYVDKAGIADELDEHSRAKEGYLGRMDFLGRVEAKREEDLKSARQR